MAFAVAVRVATSAGSGEGVFGLGGFAGVVLVAVAVGSGSAGLVHWGVGLIGVSYVASTLVIGGGADSWAPAMAVILLVSSELAGWSIDSRRRGRDDLAVHALRLRTVVVIATVAGVLAFVTHGSGSVGAGGDALPALAVGALLASLAGLCALMLAFRRSA